MNAIRKSIQIEMILFVRGFFGFFFTFFFPILMLFLFGSIYGNEPTTFYGGRGAMDMAVPSYIAMVIGVNGLMSFPLSLIEYTSNRIYKRFDATPYGKGIIMNAQIFVNFIMTALGILLLILGGRWIYQIQIDGNWLMILGSIILSMLAIFSLGFFIVAISPHAKIANLLCYLLYFIMLFLSGASLPSELFPASIKKYTNLLPLTHVVELMKGTFTGMPWSELWVNVLALGVIFVVLGGLGLMAYRKQNWN